MFQFSLCIVYQKVTLKYKAETLATVSNKNLSSCEILRRSLHLRNELFSFLQNVDIRDFQIRHYLSHLLF